MCDCSGREYPVHSFMAHANACYVSTVPFATHLHSQPPAVPQVPIDVDGALPAMPEPPRPGANKRARKLYQKAKRVAAARRRDLMVAAEEAARRRQQDEARQAAARQLPTAMVASSMAALVEALASGEADTKWQEGLHEVGAVYCTRGSCRR